MKRRVGLLEPTSKVVLTAGLLSLPDRKVVSGKLSRLPVDGSLLKEFFRAPDGTIDVEWQSWNCHAVDHLGRVWAVCYRGAEVMLYFRREHQKISVGPTDPVPFGSVREPADVWVRQSLLFVDRRSKAEGVQAEVGRLQAEIYRLKQRLIVLGESADGEEDEDTEPVQRRTGKKARRP